MQDLFKEALTQGTWLILNFDQHDPSDFTYPQLYDPDIDHLVGLTGLP